MIDPEGDGSQVVAFGAQPAAPEDLPYKIELWDLRRSAVERLLARAANLGLARAIFAAAQSEHLGRYLTIKRGERLIAETD